MVFIAALKVFFFATILPAVIFRFKKLKNNPKEEIKKTLKSYFRSVLFLGLACSIPPTINCHLMKLFGYTGRLPGFISQIFGMIWVALETFQRQREIGLFLIPKAAQSFWNVLVNRKFIPEIKGLETAIVILSIAFIGLASS
jgi:tellurite resistance protein TehA-like permease